jgi:cobalt-zinc-cadmium efflux system membrane fusion protein
MMASIEIDTVQQSIVKHELRMTGKVTFDQENTQKIFPLASGRVLEVKAELGDYVHKGDVLAVINSSEAADYESQISATESRLVIAERNLNVAKDMYNDGLTSQREYTTAQKEFQIAQSEVKRVKEVLKIYNITGASNYTVKSPISGFLVEKKITPDFYIRADNNDNIFTISDISNVWVMVNLFEVDLEKVKVGYEADVKTLSYDKVYHGTVDKIFNVVDPETRTLKARIKLHNADYSLKPEMFANVSLYYHDSIQLPCIPSKAIIFNNNRNYVMVVKDKCHIETREIIKDDDFRENTYIKSGVKPGEKIISKLQLLIFNQLNN